MMSTEILSSFFVAFLIPGLVYCLLCSLFSRFIERIIFALTMSLFHVCNSEQNNRKINTTMLLVYSILSVILAEVFFSDKLGIFFLI